MADPVDLDTAPAAPTLAIDVAEVGQPLPVATHATAPTANVLAPPADEVATAVASLGAKMRYAEVIVRSSLVPKSLTHTGRGRNAVALPIEQAVANVVVVMEYGQLLNLHPMIAMAEINVLDGKPGCSGKLMRAKLNEAGHELVIHENSRQRAEVSIRLVGRPGSENARFSFDLDDALKAELIDRVEDGKAIARSDYGKVLPWEAYTDTMLFERAMAKAVRALCPEVTMGISYTIEELESMTRDVEAPVKDPVWPHDYGNATNLRDVATAKTALLDLCGGDKAKAVEVWGEHFDHLPVQGLVLGHLRAALGLPAPDGDDSVTPPLPLAEEGGSDSEAADDMVTGNQAGHVPEPALEAAATGSEAPDPEKLAAWLRVYERLAKPDLLGDDGWAEFQAWGKANQKRSNARTKAELDEVVGKAREVYSNVHGGPHGWDPDELESVAAKILEMEGATDQRPFEEFEAFTFERLADALAPETWTTDQRDAFLPWLMLGATPVEKGAADERPAA